MALLKYFKIEKRGLPLPNPSGSLNQQLSSTAIEEANKEVTAVLCADPAKRQPYLKISPEQKAIQYCKIAMLLITGLLMILEFSEDFPENSLKESTIRAWMEEGLFERTFFAEKS